MVCFLKPWCWFLLWLSLFNNAYSQEKEYQVKAAFLYNFTKFIEWPPEALNSKNFRICVIGNNPFDGALAPLEKKTLQNLTIKVDSKVTLTGISSCNVLYVSSSEAGNIEEIIEKAKSTPILTVSDIDGFINSGEL